LIRSQKLTLSIDSEKVTYRFYPFLKEKIIYKEDIKAVSVDSYDPISEYGGWGIKIGRKGRAYTTSGTHGVTIFFQNGKKILIGTGHPQEVFAFLNSAGYAPGTNMPAAI
jgi:hypothetical protein